jgi:hypothetical protein
VERVAREIDSGELGVGNFDAFWIFLFIQFGAYFEAGVGCRRRDQLDDGPEAQSMSFVMGSDVRVPLAA